MPSSIFRFQKFVRGFFEAMELHGFWGSFLDRLGFLLLLVCLSVMWRRGKDLRAWAYMLGIAPAMSGIFTSFLRYESIVFPLFVALAASVVRFERAWPMGFVWLWGKFARPFALAVCELPVGGMGRALRKIEQSGREKTTRKLRENFRR